MPAAVRRVEQVLAERRRLPVVRQEQPAAEWEQRRAVRRRSREPVLPVALVQQHLVAERQRSRGRVLSAVQQTRQAAE